MKMMTAEQAAKAAKGLTFEKVWAAMMEDRQRTAESERRMEESFKRMEKTVADLSKNLGGLGNSLGDLTEALFTNELWEKFRDIGIPVTGQSSHRKFGDHDGRVLTEVDLLIENGEYAVLVEIKTNLKAEFVDDHLERMEIVRRYLDERGDKRKLIGAVAGANVPEEVMKYAHKQGLYVVLQNGESVSIAKAPRGFKAREW